MWLEQQMMQAESKAPAPAQPPEERVSAPPEEEEDEPPTPNAEAAPAAASEPGDYDDVMKVRAASYLPHRLRAAASSSQALELFTRASRAACAPCARAFPLPWRAPVLTAHVSPTSCVCLQLIEENRRKNEAKRAAQSARNAEIIAAFEQRQGAGGGQ